MSRRVLIAVEGELRGVLGRMLSGAGHGVTEVPDGGAALAALKAAAMSGRLPEFLVTSNDLRIVDGVRLLSIIRRQGWPIPTAILVARLPETVAEARALVGEARGLGASLMQRPFDLAGLRESIERSPAVPVSGPRLPSRLLPPRPRLRVRPG